MRLELEAVADYLSRIGAMKESDAVIGLMKKLGWSIDKDHPIRWRSLIAVLRKEIDVETSKMNWRFIFERMSQLMQKASKELARSWYTSNLMKHLFVERFNLAVAHLDDETFKLEYDILCGSEDILNYCLSIENQLYETHDNSLYEFLKQFMNVFGEDEPRDAWLAFYEQHQINNLAFQRDMKRALWVIEKELIGDTKIEQMVAQEQERPTKRLKISRAFLDETFAGDDTDWSDLCVINSIQTPKGPKSSPKRKTPASTSTTAAAPEPSTTIRSPATANRLLTPSRSTENPLRPVRLPFSSSSSSKSNSRRVTREVTEEPPQPSSASRPSQRSVPSKNSRNTTPVHSNEKTTTPTKRAHPTSRSQSDAGISSTPKASPRRPQHSEEEEKEDEVPHREAAAAAPSPAPTPNESTIPSSRNRAIRKRWSKEEVDALMEGLREFKMTTNLWVSIKEKYHDILHDRTNVDLKDKYRNLLKARKIPPIGG